MTHAARSRALVFTVLAVSIAVALSGLASGDPLPLRDLPREPTWFADVEAAELQSGPQFTKHKVFVPTSRGVAVYPRRCADRCEPLWRSALRETFIGYDVAARAGHVVVRGERRLFVFDSSCATRRAVCWPIWSTPGRTVSAHIVGSSVVAAFNETEGIRLAIFPLACVDLCTPTWERVLRGDYPAYGPTVLAHDVLYLRRGSVLYGVSLGCALDAGRCAVVFRVGHVPDATFPAVTADRVIFGTGRNEEQSELAAYPTGCGHDCSPLWTVDTGGYVEGPPTPAGDVVVTSSIGRIAAYPIDCGSPCTPEWTAEVPGYAVPTHGDDEWLVAVSHRRSPAVYVFPADCTGSCPPVWSRAFTDRSQAPNGTAVDGRNLFVAFPDRVIAYRAATGRRAWRGKLHPGDGWWLDVGPRSLAVFLDTGTLDMFVAER